MDNPETLATDWLHKTQDDEWKTNTIENKNTTQHRKLFKEE